MAEGAVQGAADLAGDAERARGGGALPAHVGDVDGLDLDAGGRADQPLARAVAAHLPLHHLGPGDDEMVGEAAPHLLGHVAHGGEVGGAVMVDPAPELGGAHLRLVRRDGAAGDQGGGEFRAGEAGEVRRRNDVRRAASEVQADDGRGVHGSKISL